MTFEYVPVCAQMTQQLFQALTVQEVHNAFSLNIQFTHET